MEPYEIETLQHVVDRFELYNTDAQHSASFSLPLLDAVVSSLQDACTNASVSSPLAGPALTIFSCHDTNILGMLYILRNLGSYSGPDTLAGVNRDGQIDQSILLPRAISWPGFGMFS